MNSSGSTVTPSSSAKIPPQSITNVPSSDELDEEFPSAPGMKNPTPSEGQKARAEKEDSARRLSARRVRRALERRGNFLSDGQTAFYFNRKKKALIPIDPDDLQFRLLLREEGIIHPSRQFDVLSSELQLHAVADGDKVRISRVTFYDKSRNTLYWDKNDGMMYRITTEGIDLIPNGTDMVLFLSQEGWEPFELLLEKPLEGSPYHDFILEGMQFDESWMPDYCQARIMRTWTLAGLARELVPVLAGLILWGEYQSGKTTAERKIGCALKGSAFDVDPMPTTPEAFEFLAGLDRLLFLDNVDTKVHWFNDRVASVITGGAYRRRKLYSDNQIVTSRFMANMIISCFAPHFTRDDVASRFVVIRTAKITQCASERQQIDDVLSHRNEILTDLALEIQGILRIIPRFGAGRPETLRLSDFAYFTRLVAEYEQWDEGEVDELLALIASRQRAFSAENDPLLDLLMSLLDAKPCSLIGATASEVHALMSKLADEERRPRGVVPSTVALGRWLSRLASSSNGWVTITERRVRGNRKLYTVMPLPDMSGSGEDAYGPEDEQ